VDLVSPLGSALRVLRKTKLGMVSASIIVGLTLIAAIAPVAISPDFVYSINSHDVLAPPSISHIFGTDAYGRDLLRLCLLAISTDLQLAYEVTAVSLLLGILVGALAGYGRSAVDEVLMRFTDVFLSIPAFILAMAVAVSVGGSLFDMEIALIVAIWPSYARIVRGQVLSEKNKLYVDSLRLLNVPRFRILFRHILPNASYPIISFLTIQIGVTILFLSGLSFLGFGSGPFTPELGRIISDGIQYFLDSPWIVIFPGLILSLIALSFNLLGDALRDVYDPRMRNIREV
jgi:peptide/nickel transport system permease protein